MFAFSTHLPLPQFPLAKQAVFRCAVGCSPCISSLPSAPIHVFSVERCVTAKLPAEGSIPNRATGLQTLYREQERRKRVVGWRRTHKDPFEGEWEQIISWLVAHPERSSGDIFRELQRRSPGRYQPLQIRTHKPRDAENPSSPNDAVIPWSRLRTSGRGNCRHHEAPGSAHGPTPLTCDGSVSRRATFVMSW